ncbi:putative retrotransposon hot spot protein (RHS) [Trypanosoma cruzi]|uniref:Putative retrotransposon hot spot protein (RHS) n=1 Tax=Trypanosoma cruzi TaxID=5693 RepID=A0A2V2UMG2_TRYCR|nr:putative retrotransposon hot spot protein (RHS) [Trypanosoma cruzi]RNC40887.1 retrotransposon hot spot (RHS) protein [Trypanosoma cruzi]
MEVREGKPPQSWTYRAVGRTLEKDDGVEQSGAPRLRLMVLTSDKGWSYSWRKEIKSTRYCYVNCEVERVWQVVKGDLTKWFNSLPEEHFTPIPHALIGTPGIGKSLAAGSYLLYQLLHYDVRKLPLVAYVIKNSIYLFDKTKKNGIRPRKRGRFRGSFERSYSTWCEGLYYLRLGTTGEGTAFCFTFHSVGHDCGDTTEQKQL